MNRLFQKYSFTVLCLIFIALHVRAGNYFQQTVNYNIHVRLNDTTNELFAHESMEYINHSPDTLHVIYMHLWANGYKNDSTAMAKQMLQNGNTTFYYASEKDRGYIDQLNFKVNGQEVKWEYVKPYLSVCKIILPHPLLSGDSIRITTPFHVKIPSGKISRMGHIGQSYQISQWYPKPAVYDKNGWNYFPYLNQGEFYSEYGTFNVFITLPNNYVVGATGNLVDGQKELAWLNQKVRETEAIKTFSKSDSFPPSSPIMKTLHYRESRVHDFAWFADKRYHVLKGHVTLPHTQRKVTTWVMFTNEQANLWKNSLKYMHDAIYYYSLWVGDYAYKNVTAVDGTISAGGGMEYPTITVIGHARNAFELETTIAHELGHNWFYGIFGTNERKEPWMDEGINSFYEYRYLATEHPNAKLLGKFGNSKLGKAMDLAKYKHKYEYELSYFVTAAKNEDQAIELPAPDYTTFNYAADVYCKTAIAFDYLRNYLGDNLFDQTMQTYFDKWAFKHPQPEDIRKVFDDVTQKNLSWFFDDMLKTTKKLDYKIVTYKALPDSQGYDITLKNVGQINGPVAICGVINHKLRALVWYGGFSGKRIVGFPPGDYDYFKIDYPEYMPEINRDNNTMRTHGIFRKVEPISLQPFGSLDDPDKTQLFYSPILGWNNYNKFMLGMAVYNSFFPQKKFEYQFAPLYGFGNKDLAGYGNMQYNFLPNSNVFQQITLGVTGARFAYSTAPFNQNFNKITPELLITFRKKNLRSTLKHTLKIRNVNLINDSYKGNYTVEPPQYTHTTIEKNISDITYTLTNSRVLNPYNASLDFQTGDNMAKIALTANYSISFQHKKSIDFRFFGGSFINTDVEHAGPYRFRMSGQRGYQDYLYDHIYLGRTESSGWLSQQFTETDGAFKVYTALGQSPSMLGALNMKASLPGPLPIRIFADIGSFQDNNYSESKFLYDAGLDLSFAKNIFEVYFPVAMSGSMQTYMDVNQIKYYQNIRFRLNINMLNPFQSLGKILRY